MDMLATDHAIATSIPTVPAMPGALLTSSDSVSASVCMFSATCCRAMVKASKGPEKVAKRCLAMKS